MSLEIKNPIIEPMIPKTNKIEKTVPIFLGILNLFSINLTTGSIIDAKKYAIMKGTIYFHNLVNKNIARIIKAILSIVRRVLLTPSVITYSLS
jgi:hypothetical protein